MSPYAVSKLATEAYTLAHGLSFDLDTLVFRFFNVFGPLQAAGHAYAAVVPAFINAVRLDEPVTIYGDGLQTRDFTYVGTVARVLADAVAGRVVSRGPINLAFGSRSTLLQLLVELEKLVGHPIERRHVEPRRGDIRDSQASSDRLRSLFPAVTPTELSVGLADTLAWFRRM
jgi:UDP-glucose 4-epimerase